jgi:prepilin-type N-terminal cleavage/methylation domain-containing protein
MRLSRSRGVTLIELMIGLFIMAMLLLAAMPFGARWVSSNRQMEARSLLWEGVSQARAMALRNPSARRATEPAAMLRLRAGWLEVMVAGVETPVWSTQLRDGVRLKLADLEGYASADALANSSHPDFDCVNFDARGVRLPGADGCADSDLALGRIAVGLSNQDPLYVDML